MAGVTILEHELSELRLLVERQAGILLDCPNSALAAHVAEYLESHELESPAALLNRLRACDQDPSALPEFLDGVLNVNTGFFRHPGAMSTLARHVLPQLYARRSDDGPCTLRIWSAGCSTGEETYSIAMALCEALPGVNGNGAGNGSANGNGAKGLKDPNPKDANPKDRNASNRSGGIENSQVLSAAPASNGSGATASAINASAFKEWSIHIVGTDLLPSAIEVAERGLYPQSALTGLPPATIRACFSKIGSPNGSNGASNGAFEWFLRSFAERGAEWLEPECLWQRFEQRLGEWLEQRRAPAGQAAPAQPGHLQYHEPDQAGLHWPLRLHLLHGRAAASLARPAHRPHGAPASLPRTRRISLPQPDRKALRPEPELPLRNLRRLHLPPEAAGGQRGVRPVSSI